MLRKLLALSSKHVSATRRTIHSSDNLLRKFGGQKQLRFRVTSRHNRPQGFASGDDNNSELAPDQYRDIFDESVDEEIMEISQQESFVPGMGHKVLLIQPIDRKKRHKMAESVTTSELQRQEAVALAETLPNWIVLESKLVPSNNIRSIMIFGRGKLKMIKDKIESNKRITALFISTDMLQGRQHHLLETFFRVPVYDRYTVVLQIFKDHAHTREAVLQVALAEIPHLRSRLTEMHMRNKCWHRSSLEQVGGAGTVFMATRKQALKTRETKIKSLLGKLKEHRKKLRTARKQRDIPIVAVVGYTNSGKTSLIKALTDREKLIPKDQLFATLDVTAHGGRLPSNLEVIYMDTVGFISRIPTSLIASFNATLEDILEADLIVHVRDLSHPDTEYQKINVLETLDGLKLPQRLIDSIVEVNNKIDKCDDKIIQKAEDGSFNISATEGFGLAKFLQGIEDKILDATKQVTKLFRVRIGSDQESWLRRIGGVKEIFLDKEKQNFYLMRVVMSRPAFSKFCHQFNVGKKS